MQDCQAEAIQELSEGEHLASSYVSGELLSIIIINTIIYIIN